MMTPINPSHKPISKREIDNEIDDDHHRSCVAVGGRVQPLQILTLMMLMLTVAPLAKAIEDDDSTTREEQPGRPRFFRFSHHRQRSSSVQPNEFYQLSMNASLEACGEGKDSDMDYNDDAVTTGGSKMGVTERSGIDGNCQHKIVARISIETAPAASGHHSWDNDDMHLHFLLDEVYLPDEAEYGKPKDTFAINVTLEVPYVRHRLEKVQVLNCYVTGHDPTEKVHSTRPTTTMEWNTDEMVSPALEPPQVETKEHQIYNDGDEEEPNDWEWEHQKNLGKVYEGGKRGGFRFQGNDEAGVYDDSYGFDVGGDEPLSKDSNQHFSDHFRYRHQQVESQRAKHGRNFQLTTKRATSSIYHTTNRRHQSSENGNRIYFRDDDASPTDAIKEDEDAYDQYDNYHHLEGNGPSRTKRSGGSRDHQLKKFGVYMAKPDENASHVEYSSVVSIRYWQDPTEAPSASQAEDVVKYIRLTSSSNIYVNQISSIRFQAGAVGADADGPDAATVSTRKNREPRRRQPGGNGGGVDKKNRHPKETDSRKNNHRFISPGSDDCLTKSRAMNWSSPNELMLIDPSGMGRGGDWGAPSVKRRSSSGGGNWAEKLLWVGGEAGDELAGNDGGGDDDAGNRLKRKSFWNEETTPDGGRLFCPGLGPWRETVKVESLKAHFGGTRTRLKHCDDGLCLEVPVPAAAMAVAFKYEIQLAYSADLVAPLDQNHQNQQQQPDGHRIKITNIITTFHGPMVNDDGESSSSKKRTPTATHKKGNNIMLLEVALVYLGHSPQHQQQRRHHSELVQVNIDARCLSYLSSIGTTTGGGDDEAAAAADANQQQAPKMVRLKPEELQTVLFRFPIDGGAVAVKNEEFECGVTVTQAGTDLSGPSKSATRSRRYSDSNSSNDSSESSPAPLSSHSTAAVVLAERKFLIKPGARCVCSDFACRCTCLLGMVSPAEPKSTPLGTGAGPSGTPGSGQGPGASDGSCQMIITFGASGEDRNHQHHPQARGGGFWHWFWMVLPLAMFVLILLGCVKAVLGCCWIRIGKWKYDFLQPVVRYKDASSYRRFLINAIFFLVYPCVLCCRCFERSIDEDGDDDIFQSGGDDERDRLLQQHGLLKGVMVVQKPVPLSTTSVTSADEEDVLGDGWHTANGGEGLGKRSWKKNPEDVATTDDDELSKLLASMQSESEGGKRPVVGAKHGTKPYNNTEDEDNDTRFVMDVMNQSRKSLRTLSSSSEAFFDTRASRTSSSSLRIGNNEDEQQQLAGELVQSLIQAKIVYRRMDHACGQVLMEDRQPYSIQGYFIPIDRRRYQFFTHAVLRQFWVAHRDEEGNISRVSIPERSLISKSFTKTYHSKGDVLRQNELSVTPDKEAPCVNVEYS